MASPKSALSWDSGPGPWLWVQGSLSLGAHRLQSLRMEEGDLGADSMCPLRTLVVPGENHPHLESRARPVRYEK